MVSVTNHGDINVDLLDLCRFQPLLGLFFLTSIPWAQQADIESP
jgi:hypothetical protein